MAAQAMASLRVSIHHPLLSVLPSVSSLEQARQAHAQLLVSGLFLHPFPPSKLLSAVLPISLPYAHSLFLRSPSPPLFSFNSLIRAHSSPTSLLLFRLLLRSPQPPSPSPNHYTLTFLLSSRSLSSLELLQLSGHVVRRGFLPNLFVANSLVRALGASAMPDAARNVFDGMPERDLYSWNSMIAAYVAAGEIASAREVFDRMPLRDVVSWTSLLAGYVQVGCFMEALDMFNSMQFSGVDPNEFTLTAVLAACANLVALDQGRWIHTYIERANVKINDRLLAGLIDMYSKCGEIDIALRIFNSSDSTKFGTRPWNAMLGGFAIHGRSDEAIKLFEKMKAENIAPDEVTFISLLSACSHGRLVAEGRLYFDSMKIYGIIPKIEHYGCMVDLLGRAGHLKDAEEMIATMPMAPDIAIWGALLGACRIYRDVEMGERIGKLISNLEPKQVGCQVLLANLFSRSNRWDEAKHVRKRIEDGGGRKIPGCSSIELDGRFHQFLVGDRSHPQTKDIYAFLDDMAIRLKKAGYVPEIEEVLLDVDEEDKETALSRHSEKLAIAFGLINTPPGTPIRIVKNLRVCLDCHDVTKFISKVYGREIIVRDRIRFHHFRNGSCSCKDYW